MRNRINTTRPGSGLLAACAAAFLAGLVSPAPAQAQNVGSAGQNWSSSWGFSSSADRSLRLQQAQVIRNAETTADPSTVVYNNNIYDYRSNYQEVNTGGDNTAAVDYQIGDNIGQNTNAVGSMNTGSTDITVNGNDNAIDANNSADNTGCINGSVLNETLSLLETLSEGGDLNINNAAEAIKQTPCG
ncbi:MAG: hypothetical protein R3D65_06430 [Zhengella sp.]|uniref:hypothetical protein n=1 Tax=Zhengella sp. TaxID=2282762 RepID=UPI003527F5DE